MIRRRSFLAGLAAALAAPAVVHAASIMPVRVPPLLVPPPLMPPGLVPVLWGDGVHDDAPAINAMLAAGDVLLPEGLYLIRSGVVVPPGVELTARHVTLRAAVGFPEDAAMVNVQEGARLGMDSCIFVGGAASTALRADYPLDYPYPPPGGGS